MDREMFEILKIVAERKHYAEQGIVKQITGNDPLYPGIVEKTDDYIESFVFESGFEDKRFQRFVTKSKNYLMGYLQKVFVAEFDERQKQGTPILTMEDFFADYFQCVYSNIDSSDSVDYPYSCRSLLDEYTNLDVELTDKAGELTQLEKDVKMLRAIYVLRKENPILGMIHEDYRFDDVAKREFATACKELIRFKAIQTKETINKGNYFLVLPNCIPDALFLLTHTVRNIAVDIDRLCNSTYAKSILQNIHNEDMAQLAEQTNKAEEKVKELTHTLVSKDLELNAVKSQLSSMQQSQNTISNTDKLVDVERKLNKALKNYANLEEKYNELKDQMQAIAEASDEEDVIEESDKLIDYNGKYVFVLHKQPVFEEAVRRVFPNAIFVENNFESIHAGTTDMVVVMTPYISHHIYNGVKSHCKSKGITMIHCNKMNVGIIEKIMKEHI